MSEAVTRLISAWPQVAKRSLAHWRLLSTVVVGVLLASAILAGTVVYFDALRELALSSTLAKHATARLDILVKAGKVQTSAEEYARVKSLVDGEIDARVAWMLRDRILAGRTPTFFLTAPGNEDQAGLDNARSYFAFLPQLQQHTTLLDDGNLPSERRLNPSDEPPELEAVISLEDAQSFGVGPGDRLVAVPTWEDANPYATVVISGVFQRSVPDDDEFWHLEQEALRPPAGSSFRTVGFYISENAFMEVLGSSFRSMDSTYSWLLDVDTGRLNARNSALALANMEVMNRSLASALALYHQSTALDNALKDYDRRLFFGKLPMFVVLILIALVILYYVATLSSLLVQERRSEVALMRSRGASSTQILAVFVLEGATIAVLAVLAGPLLAAIAISVLGYTPVFSELTGGAGLAVTVSGGAYMMSALGGGLSFVALMVPAVQASRIGVTRHRQQAARPSGLPAFQRYYVDVLLLILSILLFRQLTEQGSVVATSLFGAPAVNQMLLALPGLVLIATAMVLLRLFPLAMNLSSRILSRRLSAGLVIGVWQMARDPTHYARLSLLLILTAGLGIFASSFEATLDRSFEERVLFGTGSDIRVHGLEPTEKATTPAALVPLDGSAQRSALVETFEQVPGIDRASLVLRSPARDLTNSSGGGFEMFAVDADSFGEVAWFRGDFADRPVAGLVESLKVTDLPQGIVLPAEAVSLAVRIKADRLHPTVRLTARVKNAQDRYSDYTLGELGSSEWMVLETRLAIGNRQPPSSLPLTLVSLQLFETGFDRRLQPGSVLFDEIVVRKESGETRSIEQFDDVASWSVIKTTPDAIGDELRVADQVFDRESGTALLFWSAGSPLTVRGISHGPKSFSLPVLASKSFVQATGHSLGERFEVSVGEVGVPVELVDVVDLFPTMISPNKKFLVADIHSLTSYFNLAAVDRELIPTELWLSTAPDGPERKTLVQSLEGIESYSVGSVRDRMKRLAESRVDPLVEAGWKALLFIAFSAVLVLSSVGLLVHAYVSFRDRQLHFALLRSVGLSLRQLLTTLWFEQVLVIAVGMALGTWMGGRLSETIMPYLGHDDWGGQVIPPFAIEVNWGALLITYAAMLLVFAVIIAGLIWLVRKMSLHRVLRLGEM